MTGRKDVGIKGKGSWRGEHMERGGGDMGKEEVGTWRQGVGTRRQGVGTRRQGVGTRRRGGKHGKRRDGEHKEKQMPTGTSCTMLGDAILMGD